MKVTGIKEKIKGILGKLKELPGKIKDGFSLLFGKAASFFKNIKIKDKQGNKKKVAGRSTAGSAARKSPAESPSFLSKFRGTFTAKTDYMANRFLGHFPEEKRRLILFSFAGLCALLLILLISAVAINSGKNKNDTVQDRMAGIPHEELFYPVEPNFVPDFILAREPRYFWTAEDVRPYWKSPAYPEFWQGEIKNAVDKLMEGVQ